MCLSSNIGSLRPARSTQWVLEEARTNKQGNSTVNFKIFSPRSKETASPPHGPLYTGLRYQPSTFCIYRHTHCIVLELEPRALYRPGKHSTPKLYLLHSVLSAPSCTWTHTVCQTSFPWHNVYVAKVPLCCNTWKFSVPSHETTDPIKWIYKLCSSGF